MLPFGLYKILVSWLLIILSTKLVSNSVFTTPLFCDAEVVFGAFVAVAGEVANVEAGVGVAEVDVEVDVDVDVDGGGDGGGDVVEVIAGEVFFGIEKLSFLKIRSPKSAYILFSHSNMPAKTES